MALFNKIIADKKIILNLNKEYIKNVLYDIFENKKTLKKNDIGCLNYIRKSNDKLKLLFLNYFVEDLYNYIGKIENIKIIENKEDEIYNIIIERLQGYCD